MAEGARRPAPPPAPAWALLLAIVVALAAVAVAGRAVQVADFGRQGPLTDPTDFVAFYCGGTVLAERRDPYRAEPLRTCERAALAASGIAMRPHLVVPAPLPPYALAAFALLSHVPFRAACLGFFICSLAMIGAAIWLCLRLANVSPAFVAATLGIGLAAGSLVLGQIVPLAAVALCGCALALRGGKVTVAAGAALAMMIEPHIGLASVLGLFILERRTRLALGLGALALGGISLAAAGLAVNREYFTQVLPAHALSEVANFAAQLSLTATAFALGTGATTALHLGEASYVAMLVLGIEGGRGLARRFGDRAFIALTPPAATLVGGIYIHEQQMALALPFAFLLARYARPRALAYAAVAVLAVPWEGVVRLALLPLFPSHVAFAPSPALASVAGGSLLADTVWQAWLGVGGRDGRTPLEIFAFKLPVWFALGSLAFVAVHALRAGPLGDVRHKRPQLRSRALRSEIRR